MSLSSAPKSAELELEIDDVELRELAADRPEMLVGLLSAQAIRLPQQELIEIEHLQIKMRLERAHEAAAEPRRCHRVRRRL